jgi:hypothetical protein
VIVTINELAELRVRHEQSLPLTAFVVRDEPWRTGPEDPARRIRRLEVARHVSEGPAAASALLGQTDERGILVCPARRFREREAQREDHCEADGPDHERISIDTISPWSSA